MRHVLLLAGLISVSGCDFDTEYDRIWCERHPTTPERCPPVDAGVRDAGTSDAGTSDAGTSDAGSSDAGCARKLVIEAPTSSGSYDCVGLLLRVACEDGTEATTTEAVTVDLSSTVLDAGTLRGNFFPLSGCNGTATSTVVLPAGVSTLRTVSYNTGVATLAPVFGAFRLRASSTAAGLAPGELVMQRTAELTIDPTAKVPIDAGCVLLPKPRLASFTQNVIAPFDLTVSYTLPPPLTGCGGLELTVARNTSTPDGGVWVSATAVGNANVQLTASTSWLAPIVLPVHACHGPGFTTDTMHCCNGGMDGGICL